jgi:hypothetical protein
MDATINYLQSHKVTLKKEGELQSSSNSTTGATVGMLWLDVEGTSVREIIFFCHFCTNFSFADNIVLVQFNQQQR